MPVRFCQDRGQLWPCCSRAGVREGDSWRVRAGAGGWLRDSVRAQLWPLPVAGVTAAARTVLEAVSGSLITVTSLTFSLTVVTLQLASSQFSPRLLRTFTRDLFVQVTLAVFLATFT